MDQIFTQVMEYARATWRYRWYALVVAWLVAVLGWSWVSRLPDQYKASARVYVDTQTLLAPLLSGLTVRPRIDAQLEMMTRTLLSRPNLEEVARRTDLDITAKTPEAMEHLVDHLSKQITLASAGRTNLYTLSYQDSEPKLARSVVQTLLNMFVESGLGNTRKDLRASQNFLDQQVTAYKQRLEAMEDRIKNFKREYMGMIPGENESDYYGQLQQSKEQLRQSKLDLEEAIRRRDSFNARLQGTEPVLLETPTPASGNGLQSELDGRIAAMESKLDEVQLRYTPQHPDVLAIKRALASLEAQRKRELEQRRKAGEGINAGAGNASPYIQNLRFALAKAESQVASLQARVDTYEQRYDKLKAAVDKIPAVQAQYKDLTRDYSVIKDNYEKLLVSREKATLSGVVQASTNTVDFRVIDPPHVPPSPVGPNRILLSSGALLAALGAGIGVAFLLGQLRPMVMSRQVLEQITSRPFLGAVSLSETPRMLHARRVGLTAYALSSLTLVVVFGLLASFYLVG